MLKLNCLKGKDKWIFLLTMGIILCILAFPAERISGTGRGGGREETGVQYAGNAKEGESAAETGGEAREVFVRATSEDYEGQLERRVENILKNVEGVGKVDVMIVLKSSSEKVWQMDTGSSSSVSEESDANGTSRRSETAEQEAATVVIGGEDGDEPMLSKEVYPEIAGIVISAQGGGDFSIQAEISAAMEALFGLPAHKIKILKRVQ